MRQRSLPRMAGGRHGRGGVRLGLVRWGGWVGVGVSAVDGIGGPWSCSLFVLYSEWGAVGQKDYVRRRMGRGKDASAHGLAASTTSCSGCPVEQRGDGPAARA